MCFLARTIFAVGAIVVLSLGIPAQGQKLYWGEYQGGSILRSNLDGSNVEALITSGLGVPSGVAVDTQDRKLYWGDFFTRTIHRANLDGSEAEIIITPGMLGGPHITASYAVATQARKLYWSNTSTSRIQRSNLDGSFLEPIVVSIGGILAIDIDEVQGRIYMGQGGGGIWRSNLDGSNLFHLITPHFDAVDVALDLSHGRIYWATLHDIYRANLNGSQIQLLVLGLGVADGLVLDVPAGKMIWSDRDSNKIQRANLGIPAGQTPENRTDIEDLIIGLGEPASLELDLTCGALGDGNADGRVEFADFGDLQRCYTGPGPASPFRYQPQCRCLDFNADGDIDRNDVGAFFSAVWQPTP